MPQSSIPHRSIQTLSLSPSEVTTTDNLIAIVSAFDIDGDSVTIGYAWYVNGNVVQQGSDSSLNGNYFEVGDEITVVATPLRRQRLWLEVQQSDTIDVLNTPPVIEQHVLARKIRPGGVLPYFAMQTLTMMTVHKSSASTTCGRINPERS